MRERGWIGVLGVALCVMFVLGTVLAEENLPAAPGGKGMGKGPGKGAWGPGKRVGQRQHRMGNEAIRKEFERFQEAMKSLKEEAGALRAEIKKAIQEAHKGEGKPTPEKIKEVVAAYEDEAKSIAGRMVGERIKHHENIVSILNSEKDDMIERLTKMLLSPRKGQRGGRGKEGLDGTPRREGRGRRRGGAEELDGGGAQIGPGEYDFPVGV